MMLVASRGPQTEAEEQRSIEAATNVAENKKRQEELMVSKDSDAPSEPKEVERTVQAVHAEVGVGGAMLADFLAQPVELRAMVVACMLFVIAVLMYCIEKMRTAAKYRALLHDFYSNHCPAKLPDIDGILWTYSGREEHMMTELRKKYI
jgi:hypothetical protein